MPARTAVRAAARLPLAVTSHPDLLDDLLRLAAAAGVELDVAADPAAARPRYGGAPMVLVGSDQADACARARLPRRRRVVLVTQLDRAAAPWEHAELIGADHVAVLPSAEPWLVGQLEESTTDPAPPGRVLGVIGGRGGAGASVLAVALAVTAVRRGLRTLLVDADPLGGGLDLALGWEDVEGLRWPALRVPGQALDPPGLVRALPGRGELVLLSFDRDELHRLPAEAMAAALDAGRSGRDLVVVDLPRHLDDAAVLALEAAERTLLVVPAELRGVAAARRVAAVAAVHCPQLEVVIRGPAPGRLRVRDLTDALGLTLAGTLRPEPGLARAMECGQAPAVNGSGPLAVLCAQLLDDAFGTAGAAA